MQYRNATSSVWYVVNGAVLLLTFILFRFVVIVGAVAHAGGCWWELGYLGGLIWSLPPSSIRLFMFLTALLCVHAFNNLFWLNKLVRVAWNECRRYLAGAVESAGGGEREIKAEAEEGGSQGRRRHLPRRQKTD